MNTGSCKGKDTMVLDEEEKEEVKKDSSGMGVNSDECKPIAQEEEDQSEFQSSDNTSSVRRFAMGNRSGISENYEGQSNSFLGVPDVCSSESAEDLGKEGDPAARKPKVLCDISQPKVLCDISQRETKASKASEGGTKTVMEDLPNEIALHIFGLSPIESASDFALVSKTWKNIIHSWLFYDLRAKRLLHRANVAQAEHDLKLKELQDCYEFVKKLIQTCQSDERFRQLRRIREEKLNSVKLSKEKLDRSIRLAVKSEEICKKIYTVVNSVTTEGVNNSSTTSTQLVDPVAKVCKTSEGGMSAANTNQLSTPDSFKGIGLLSSSISTAARSAKVSSENISSSATQPVRREPFTWRNFTYTAAAADDGNRRPISSSTDMQSEAAAAAADGNDGNPRLSTSSTASTAGVDRSPEEPQK